MVIRDECEKERMVNENSVGGGIEIEEESLKKDSNYGVQIL